MPRKDVPDMGACDWPEMPDNVQELQDMVLDLREIIEVQTAELDAADRRRDKILEDIDNRKAEFEDEFQNLTSKLDFLRGDIERWLN